VEWLGHFVLWVILVTAAVMVIIWEFSFPPNAHPAAANMVLKLCIYVLYMSSNLIVMGNEF